MSRVKVGGVTRICRRYHGKGLYSGQGRVIYANNGEHGKDAGDAARGALGLPGGVGRQKRTNGPSVRRNQFNRLSPARGHLRQFFPATDPIWSHRLGLSLADS